MKRLMILMVSVACSRSEPMTGFAPEAEMEEKAVAADMPVEAPAPKQAPARMRSRKKRGGKGQGMGGGGMAPGASLGSLVAADEISEGDGAPDDKAEAEPAATRSWFPETFLFEPMVKTDASGAAEVSVDVPDRLTTWRVLALAHSRQGAQAGTVTTFLGTLPTYVDPIVPPFLMAGDQIALPIQVVNTTDEPVTTALTLDVEGAALVKAGGTVTIPARGSLVRFAEIRATRPGRITFRAGLGRSDAVEKTIPVLPTGRPRTIEKSGTLAAPRTLEITLPSDTDPDSANVRLSVFPGALSILKSELSAGSARGGVAEDAYLLLLSGQAKGLLNKLGGKADEAWLRRLRIVATQRAMRHARAPNPAVAALLTEAALAHPESPVLTRLGERLASQLASAQRPDGTFQGGNGWTLQRLLVTTADSVRAVEAASGTPAGARRARGVALKANGAFERQLRRIDDPYTAAAVLASRAVEGSMADTLAERITKAITTAEDGSKRLVPGSDVRRPDGARPGVVEATALAALALQGREEGKTLIPDLGASILSAYRPSYGFGDGYTNLVALRAVVAIFDEPLPDRVNVELTVDGEVVAGGELSGTKLKEVMHEQTDLTKPRGDHKILVEADPAVPGLGFSLTIKYYVPWETETPESGMELMVDLGKGARVGHPLDVTLSAIAPSSMALSMRQALPAGVQVDRQSLDRLVTDGVIRRYETEDGAVTLEAAARTQGQTFTAKYRVIPTLSGTLHTSASRIEPQGRPDQAFFVPPTVWKIGR